MMGFHYLMKIAHFMNTILVHSQGMAELVLAEGVKGLIKKVWATIINCGVGKAIPPKKRRGRPISNGKPDYMSLRLADYRY